VNLGSLIEWPMYQDLFDSQVSPSIKIVTYKHLTKTSNAKPSAPRPVQWSSDSTAVSI